MNENSEPSFNVIGDKQLVEKITINIRTIQMGKNYPAYTDSKTQTLLKDNKQYKVKNEADFYEVYFSYGDQVGMMQFENLFKPLNGSMSDRINDLHILVKDNQIYLKHFATTRYKNENSGFETNKGITLEEFFEQHPEISDDEKETYKARFFNNFPADKQEFKRDSITKETVDYFKSKPLNQKKTYGIFPDDLKKMGLPPEELKEILEYYDKEKPIFLNSN
ncbi:hypothetical protein MTZ49_11005 [Entomomonas sp. E2T0]|uniref:hypothetical protein n=1 Tax=Entomomonas sp. E2T0 TaxID=2930213 RepID=UPI0022283E49|nr:hypothetical protein [Entomomonas sp. E2T0]UYZ83126.1 hypothetical protein MTZ49_11005 [Entomomonas sp. E2T0]